MAQLHLANQDAFDLLEMKGNEFGEGVAGDDGCLESLLEQVTSSVEIVHLLIFANALEYDAERVDVPVVLRQFVLDPIELSQVIVAYLVESGRVAWERVLGEVLSWSGFRTNTKEILQEVAGFALIICLCSFFLLLLLGPLLLDVFLLGILLLQVLLLLLVIVLLLIVLSGLLLLGAILVDILLVGVKLRTVRILGIVTLSFVLWAVIPLVVAGASCIWIGVASMMMVRDA